MKTQILLRNLRIALRTGVAVAACMPAMLCAQYAAGGGTATGGNAVAIGQGSTAAGAVGVAVGQNADASGVAAISIGPNTSATQAGATAIGNASSATGNSATAVGAGSTATGQSATALGFGAAATGPSITSVGDSAGINSGAGSGYNSSFGFVAGQNVTGLYNSGIGASAGQFVTGNYNSGVGAGAGTFVTGDANVAFGLQAGQYVQGNANVAIGYNAGQGTAATPLNVFSTVAIGSNAVVSADGAIAIGRSSAANYASSVALGDGSVTGTAAPTGTGFLTGSAAPGSEVSIGAAGATRRLTNVADGSAATDAVSVAQLTAEDGKVDNLGGSTATSLGGGANYNATTGMVSAPVYTIAGGSYTGVGNALVALDMVNTNQSNGVASLLGGGTTAGANGMIGGGSFQAGSTGGNYATVAQALANINTASGTDPDAVHYDDATHAQVTLNNGGAPSLVTNVAAGNVAAGSTDAVNGSQLAATNSQVTTNATDIANLNTGITTGAIGLVQQTGGAPSAGQITVGAATGGTSINVAGTDGNRVVSGVADGVAGTDAVNVGQLTAAVGGATANAVQYDDASHSSVTLNPGNAATGLHNVAAGALTATSTDAVNGSQLAATNSQVAVNTAGLIGVANQVAIDTTTIASQSTSITALQTGKAGAFQADNSGGRAAPTPTGTNAVAGGFGAVASAAQSSAIGTAALATGFNSVALGYGSTDGGVANVVSVGSVGGERQVTNVAAGTRATDAVNLGQLTSGLTNTLNQANAYTDQRLAGISYDLSRARRDASSGTASAMAMASLPQAFKPGGGLIAGGFGVYRDQTAFAFGASKAFDDGHTIMKASGTIDTHGTAGGAVGMGYQF